MCLWPGGAFLFGLSLVPCSSYFRSDGLPVLLPLDPYVEVPRELYIVALYKKELLT